MTTRQQYEAALLRVEKSERFWDRHAKGSKGGGHSLEKKYADKDPASNEDRNIVEVYRFEHEDAGRDGYFAYWSKDNRITTWMGSTLATVTSSSPERRGGFGSKRVSFRARGIDGHTYSGTYFASSGDYVRMKRVKGRTR